MHKKGTLWCVLPGQNQHLATDCEKVFRSLNHFPRDVDDGFGDFIPACREHTFPRTSPRSRVCSNSRRNIDWTSHRSSRRTTSWQPWLEIKIPSPKNPESICERETYPKSRRQSQQVGMSFGTNTRNENWSHPALRKLVRDKPGLLLIQCAFRKEFFL